jgi:hypothetical protein
MTNETAKKLFEILLNEIRANGFTDVGTFMIDEVKKNFEFEEFTENYEYVDSDTILSKYEQLTFNQQGAIIALKKLLDSSIEYFTISKRIPKRYSEIMSELVEKRDDFGISFKTINEKVEIIDTVLQNENLNEILLLLNKIRENIELDDETFFNKIEL